MKNRYKKPRLASSKKACICSETGNKINKFEEVLLNPTNGIKVYCKQSKAYQQFIKELP